RPRQPAESNPEMQVVVPSKKELQDYQAVCDLAATEYGNTDTYWIGACFNPKRWLVFREKIPPRVPGLLFVILSHHGKYRGLIGADDTGDEGLFRIGCQALWETAQTGL